MERFVVWTIKQKKIILPIDLYRRGHDFLGPALNNGSTKILFFTMWAQWVTKDAEFYVDSKYINLPFGSFSH
jgi:hypothetical protein